MVLLAFGLDISKIALHKLLDPTTRQPKRLGPRKIEEFRQNIIQSCGFLDNDAGQAFVPVVVDAAIKEYERITTFDPLSRERRLIDPLHRYELAKLYEKKGMNEKAIAQLERFLFLWKNADRDRPEPKDARKRLMALKRRI